MKGPLRTRVGDDALVVAVIPNRTVPSSDVNRNVKASRALNKGCPVMSASLPVSWAMRGDRVEGPSNRNKKS